MTVIVRGYFRLSLLKTKLKYIEKIEYNNIIGNVS